MPFQPFIDVADKLIARFGRTVTFIQNSTTAADPAKPWEGPTQVPTSSVSIPVVFIEIDNKEIDNQLVLRGDQRCLIAAADLPGLEPRADDEIQDGTVKWAIVRVKTLRPGNPAIMYDVIVRA